MHRQLSASAADAHGKSVEALRLLAMHVLLQTAQREGWSAANRLYTTYKF